MNGIYQICFNLINQYIFGNAALLDTSYEYMMCVIGATILCVMIAYAPFCVVRWFFRGIAK